MSDHRFSLGLDPWDGGLASRLQQEHDLQATYPNWGRMSRARRLIRRRTSPAQRPHCLIYGFLRPEATPLFSRRELLGLLEKTNTVKHLGFEHSIGEVDAADGEMRDRRHPPAFPELTITRCCFPPTQSRGHRRRPPPHLRPVRSVRWRGPALHSHRRPTRLGRVQPPRGSSRTSCRTAGPRPDHSWARQNLRTVWLNRSGVSRLLTCPTPGSTTSSVFGIASSNT